MLRERESWVDNLKVFGILAVILGHISSPPQAFIFTWHMPLFFIISGFFINIDRKPLEFIKKDLYRLMLPYLAFTFLGLSVEVFKRYVLGRESLDYLSELYNIYIWMDGAALINTYAFVLWFLPVLFFSRLVVFYSCKYVNNIYIQILTVILLFSASFFYEIPFAIDNALNSVLFVYIGFKIFYLYSKGLLNFKKAYYFWMPLLILGIIYLFYGLPGLDMARKNYSNIPINIVWSLLVIVMLFFVSNKLKITSKMLDEWAKNTMFVFAMHPYTNNIADALVKLVMTHGWQIKFAISIALLQVLIILKRKVNLF